MAKKTPAWKKAQQQETGAQNSERRASKPAEGTVRIRMKSDYRDVAKAGDIYETDAAKADELIKLGRAELE